MALPGGQEAHWEVVERILFLYAKLNPGQSYVQGMNEIVGPIYYTFASDPDLRWRGTFSSLYRLLLTEPATFIHRYIASQTSRVLLPRLRAMLASCPRDIP